ncbi:MAG: type II secretion system protein GspG [Candidatus Sumerlaeaceae bacterium]
MNSSTLVNRTLVATIIGAAILIPVAASAQGAIESGASRPTQGATFLGGKRAAGARPVAAQGSTRSLSSAMAALQADLRRLPTTTEGLSILIERPPGVKNWKGPYVTVGPGSITDKPFVDPWGTEYRYTNTTRASEQPSFEIRSAGPDGIFDNPDDLVIKG